MGQKADAAETFDARRRSQGQLAPVAFRAARLRDHACDEAGRAAMPVKVRNLLERPRLPRLGSSLLERRDPFVELARAEAQV